MINTERNPFLMDYTCFECGSHNEHQPTCSNYKKKTNKLVGEKLK